MDWASHLGRIAENIGEAAQFTPATGSPVTSTGLFFRPYEAALVGPGVSVSASRPRFHALSTQLPNVRRGDSLVVRTITYKVTVVDSDPVSGFTTLELEDQS